MTRQEELELENLSLEIESAENNVRRVELRIRQIQYDLEQQIERQEENRLKQVDKLVNMRQELDDKLSQYNSPTPL